MPQISYTGAFNASSLTTPDVYINVQTPAATSITSATANKLGYVGVASWGPKNSGKSVASSSDALWFGPGPVVRQNDLLTAINVALPLQQAAGVGSLVCSRVTDGTDTAATGVLGTAGLTLTSMYTGSFGNQGSATIASGAAAGSWRLTIQMPGFAAEVFDNLAKGLTGNAVWVAIAAAVNTGVSSVRGPSLLMVAAAGASTTAPVASSVTLSGGTDGVSTITSSVLVGADTAGGPTGIYALKNAGLSYLNVIDLFDTTQEATLITFGAAYGVYVHASGPVSEAVATGVAAKASAGSDSAWLKRMLGDWVYWQDNYNSVQRLLAPATLSAARHSTIPIYGSTLNKQITNVVATQTSKTGTVYSSTDLASLTNAGMDVICNPIPRGSMFGCRTGHNGSSNNAINGDNWPVMTSYLARTLAGPGALGPMIGEPITDTYWTDGYDLLDNFLSNLQTNGVIEDFSITFGTGNNPASQIAQGITVAEVLVQLYAISMIFLVNLQDGQTVAVSSSSST